MDSATEVSPPEKRDASNLSVDDALKIDVELRLEALKRHGAKPLNGRSFQMDDPLTFYA